MRRDAAVESHTGLAFQLGDVAAIGLDWVPRPISVPNRSVKVRK